MIAPNDRRAELLAKVADHVLAEGLSAASLRPLAAAAGTSDRMLLYYFKDKGDLIAAALAELMTRLLARLEEALPPTRLPSAALGDRLFELATGEALWPYMRLWLEIAALSARGDPVCRLVGEGIGRGLLAWIAGRLDEGSGPALEITAFGVATSLEGRLVLHAVGIAGGGPART
jgi:AcrR family transcriptional regulator